MSTQNRVFSRLFDADKRKQNLSREQRVALSLVQNLITEFEPLENSYSEASYFAYEWGDEIIDAFAEWRNKYNIDDFVVNGNATNLKETADIMRGYLEELESKAGDLGIDPVDIFDDYENAKSLVDNANSTYDDFIKKYREIISYVGVPDFS